MKRASVVVLKKKNKKEPIKYLILKRTPDVLLPNVWTLPGGKVDFISDENRWEDPEETAIREVLEETGLKILALKKLKITFSGSDHIISVFEALDWHIKNTVTFPNSEHVASMWVTKKEILTNKDVGEITKLIFNYI